MTYPTVISYYTKNTPYEEEAKHLIASCEKFSLSYEIEGISNLGSWNENCSYKATFILEKFEKIDGPIVWVDADAVFVRKPLALLGLKEDIGLCIFEAFSNTDPCKINTGAVFVNHTEKAKQILKEWVEESKKVVKSDFPDQVALRDVLFQTDGKIANIGTPYFTTVDHIEKKEWKEQAVIVHFQASRTLKKVLNREHLLFWDHEQLAAEKKKVLEILEVVEVESDQVVEREPF